MNPLISIIVPVYKVEPYLKQCLNSIVHQTYENIEIILIDDGSPDKCPEICDDFAKKDHRITVIHKKNGGLSEARNIGIEIAKGEFITFIDSDDWVEKDYILELYTLIRENNSQIAIGNFQQFSNDNKIFPPETLPTETTTSNEILHRIVFQENYYTIAWGKLFEKRLFQNIRFPVGKIHEDEYTGYKPYYFAKRISSTEKILYHYLRRRDSITGQEFFQDKIDIIEKRALFFHQHGLFFLAHTLYFSLCNEWLKRCRLVQEKRLDLFSLEECIKNFKANVSALHRNPHKTTLFTIALFFIAKFPRLYLIYARKNHLILRKKDSIGMISSKKNESSI